MMRFEPPPAAMSRREWRRLREENAGGDDAAEPGGAPLRILTICTGNVCRSPMAEVLLRARLEGLGVDVHSAGSRALVGREMPEPAQRLAIAHGASAEDAAAHRARLLTESVAADADLILAMSREHRTAAVERAPQLLRRTFTAREFARLSASLTDEDVRTAAEAAGTDPRARLSAVLALVTLQRGRVAPVPPQEEDVLDPYRRDSSVYEASAAQLVPAVGEFSRVLRAALMR
ncbi:arsenate reductase/protein-tyrosine-phosphatase family protein [Microbacterium tumbae]